MNDQDKAIAAQAGQVVRDCLDQVSWLRCREANFNLGSDDLRYDSALFVDTPESVQAIIIESRRSGQPRFIRAGIRDLKKCLAVLPGAYGVIVAPYVSKSGAALCAQEGVGYTDLSGNCLLDFPGVYIQRQGAKNGFAERAEQGLKTLYTPRGERILRTLLLNACNKWSTVSLAKASGVSKSQVGRFAKRMRNLEWLEGPRGQFSLSNPAEMLAEWARQYDFKRNQTGMYYTTRKLPTVEEGIARACRRFRFRYALTSFSGAARLAPIVPDPRIHAYVDGSLSDVASELLLKPVASGGNVILVRPYDEGVFIGSGNVEDIAIASPVQIYLDLLASAGRGQEAAEALLEEVIRPKW
jgi:Transcriptional regulator, AbiEi antitoxin, Type IV TA system